MTVGAVFLVSQTGCTGVYEDDSDYGSYATYGGAYYGGAGFYHGAYYGGRSAYWNNG